MPSAHAERAIGQGPRVAPATELDRLLDELEQLLDAMPPEAYDMVSGGSTVGRHVCGCLDLIEALVTSGATRVVEYRPADIDPGNRTDSLRRTRRLRSAAVTWPPCSPDAVVRVEQAAWPQGLTESGWSTAGNELAFVTNQVVDKQKTIAGSMRVFGFEVPEGFGTMELPPLRARASVPPAWELWRLLDEIDSLLADVPRETYRARFAPAVSGSIGEHVRHCLNHVAALLAADASTPLSYDRRQRGSGVETDPEEASRQVLQLKRGLEAWSARSLDDPIRVRSMISRSGDVVTGWSTLARELAFVISHTLHHQALVGVLLAIHGHDVPDRFGHSPSTPRRH